jgi:parvulin-like peptidyl-prolyl isomerase
MAKLMRALLLLSLITACNSKPQDKFEDSVITLNDNNLTGYEFSKRLVRKFIEQDIKYPKQEIMSVLKKQIIEDFILQSVFNDYAHDENILVKKEVLDEEFKKFKDGYPDSDSFEIFLNESGQSKQAFRDSLKDTIIRDLVKDKLFKEQNFEVDSKAVNEFYNQNKDKFKREEQIRLKQIVFEEEEDGIKIQELLKNDNNKNFETLAAKYSLGPEKKDGGDLGWLNTNSYAPFEEASKYNVGQITPIIKSESGFHIFKVVDKRKATTLTLAESQKSILKQLLDKKKSDYLNEWIKEQVSSSKFKINKELIDNITVNRPTNL